MPGTLTWLASFQLLEYQWSEGEFDTLEKLGSAHRPEGTPPSEGGVPPGRWAEPNYPSVINKPAATRPDASDNSMTEATSMDQTDIISYKHRKNCECCTGH